MWPDRTKMRRKTRHHVYMSRKDRLDLSILLRDTFPTIRFLHERYWESFIDLDAHRRKEDSERAQGNWDTIPYEMEDPTGKPFPYLPSLDAHWTESRIAWIEAERPNFVWLPCLDDLYLGTWQIVNEPPVQLRLLSGNYRYLARDDCNHFSDDPLPAQNRMERILLEEGYLQARAPAEDEDALKLMNKLWRVVSKFFAPTSELVVCDLKTGRPFDLEPGRTFSTWIGPDAARWANERRRNYFCDSDPESKDAICYKPGNYRFPAGTQLAAKRDVPTFEEWLKMQEEEKKGAR